jgi:4-alpha-glucanotransferase
VADHERPALRRLAGRCGILDTYRRADTHETVMVTDETRERLLSAMGWDADRESSAERALAEIDAADAKAQLEPFLVVRSDEALRLKLRDPCAAPAAQIRSFRIVEASGEVREGRVEDGDANAAGEIELAPAGALSLGYHHLEIDGGASGAAVSASSHTLVVVPHRCFDIAEALAGRRGAGIFANLYTVVGSRDRGFGDFGALSELIDSVAAGGGDFVAINPLHTRNDQDRNPSPYFPSSRLYLDPLYIDLEAVAGFADDETARTLAASHPSARSSIDYAGVSAAKHGVLRRLFSVFETARARDRSQAAAYDEYVEGEGATLDRFAAHRALEIHFEAREAGRDWRNWPQEYRSPGSEAVRRFVHDTRREVEYQKWLQFEADRQLGNAASGAASAGMGVGLLSDVAVGGAVDGADAWAFQGELAQGATMGAPPDAFSNRGQEWGVVPMVPHRLRSSGFSYWRALIERAMRHAGALRIDHAMGLVRQFWVPSGASPAEGAYVAYPEQELLGVLALESVKRGVVVIGEDLGTVPEGFRETMGDRGLLRTLVMYFERRDDGSFRAPGEYAQDAVAVANTHDLSTLAGFWSGEDLDARYASGHIANPEELESARTQREYERRALEGTLTEQTGMTDRSPSAISEAVARFLAATPSALIAVALDDIAGETEAINIPGTSPPARSNWTRRMHVPLDELVRTGALAQAIRAAKRN